MESIFEFETTELKDGAVLVIKDLFLGINSSVGEIYNCSDEFNKEFKGEISKKYEYQLYTNNCFDENNRELINLRSDYPLIIFDNVSLDHLEIVSQICIENTSRSYVIFLTKKQKIQWLEILRLKDEVTGHFAGFLEE